MMDVKDKRDNLSREGSGRVGIYKATKCAHCYTLECNYGIGRKFNKLPVLWDMLNNTKYDQSNIDPQHNWIYDNENEFYKQDVPLQGIEIFKDVGAQSAVSILDLIGKNNINRIYRSEYQTQINLQMYIMNILLNTVPQKHDYKIKLEARNAVMTKNLEYFTRIRSIFKTDKLSSSFNKLLNFKLGTRSESKYDDRSQKQKSNAEIQLVKISKFSPIDDSYINNNHKYMKDFDNKTSTKASTNSSNLGNYKSDKENLKSNSQESKSDKLENSHKDKKSNHDREEKAHLLNFVLKSSRHDEKFKRLVKNAIPPSKSSHTKQLRYNSIINKREKKNFETSSNPSSNQKKTIGRELRKWSANEPKEKNQMKNTFKFDKNLDKVGRDFNSGKTETNHNLTNNINNEIQKFTSKASSYSSSYFDGKLMRPKIQQQDKKQKQGDKFLKLGNNDENLNTKSNGGQLSTINLYK